jgi:hypothetical protein
MTNGAYPVLVDRKLPEVAPLELLGGALLEGMLPLIQVVEMLDGVVASSATGL